MTMHRDQFKTLIADLSFPEGPRWHEGGLWFSDIHAHRLYRATLDGVLEEIVEIGDRTSGIGFLPDGRALVVSMLDRQLIAVTRSGHASLHADLSGLSRNFINDMVIDASGRAYVGSRNGGTPDSASDSLIIVEPDGRARVGVPDMVSPNGAVITPDGRSLIIAETAFGRLRRFAIAPDGSLGRRETLFEDRGHHIDGICLDADGGIWAGGGVGGLLRISAAGVLEDVVAFPGRMILATSLGGPEGKHLFLATTGVSLLDNLALIGADRMRDAGVNSEGRIEVCEVDIPGAPPPAA